jgi:hypothetical protein
VIQSVLIELRQEYVLRVGEGSINKPFSYVNHCNANDITKRQHYNDRDSEEGQIDWEVILMSWNTSRLCKLLFLQHQCDVSKQDFFAQ